MQSEKYQQLISQYRETHLETGWKILFRLMIFLNIIYLAVMYCTVSIESTNFYVLFIGRPIIIIIIISVDKYAYRFPIVKYNIMWVFWVIIGFLFTVESFKYEHPPLSLLWHAHTLCLFFITIAYFFNWKVLVCAFWFQRISTLIIYA